MEPLCPGESVANLEGIHPGIVMKRNVCRVLYCRRARLRSSLLRRTACCCSSIRALCLVYLRTPSTPAPPFSCKRKGARNINKMQPCQSGSPSEQSHCRCGRSVMWRHIDAPCHITVILHLAQRTNARRQPSSLSSVEWGQRTAVPVLAPACQCYL